MRPDIATQVDQTMMLIMVICIFFFLLVTGAMIYFVFRYSKKKNPVATNIHGNTTLEIAWTVIPLILVLIIFFYGWKGFENMRNVPEDAIPVKVTGQMWKWTFEYENGKRSDTLYAPLDQPMRMNIYSIDVNHSFYIPVLRVKEDAIPGRENYLWFEARNLGEYEIACAEYCGLDHWNMYAKLIVLPRDEFYAWYNKIDEPEVPATDTTASVGNDTLKTNGETVVPADTTEKVNGNNDTTKSE